ncbi:hypothetical protein [Limibacterium fermenti]|uniref:AbiTii domain-containing protein n=1 Tax=Limibacterium fermenti TaxID=3229863 RepID=UPI003A6C0E4F
MNVLTNITSLLSTEKESLTNGLYQLKLLASRIRNKELLSWINKELNGYEDDDNLPEYRIAPALLQGTYSNGFYSIRDQIISTLHFPEELKENLNKIRIKQGISIIEDAAKNKEDTIAFVVPSEISAFIMQIIRDHNPTYKLYSLFDTRQVTSHTVYKNILIKVRNHALDLALNLETEMGYEVEIEEIIKNRNEANQIIHNYLTQNITNIGDGNLINTGDSNTIYQKPTIQKGNFDQLRDELNQLGLEKSDIEELYPIINSENTEKQPKQLNEKTQSWIKKMSNKLIKNGRKITVELGISILTELIKSYLGF